MLRQDPTTGLYEQVEVEPSVIDPPKLELMDKDAPVPIKSVKAVKPEKKK